MFSCGDSCVWRPELKNRPSRGDGHAGPTTPRRPAARSVDHVERAARDRSVETSPFRSRASHPILRAGDRFRAFREGDTYEKKSKSRFAAAASLHHGRHHVAPVRRPSGDQGGAHPRPRPGQRGQDHDPVPPPGRHGRVHDPHHRVQRRDAHVQEHKVPGLGPGRPDLHPAVLAVLLPEHAGESIYVVDSAPTPSASGTSAGRSSTPSWRRRS